jgi:hypothetical protein
MDSFGDPWSLWERMVNSLVEPPTFRFQPDIVADESTQTTEAGCSSRATSSAMLIPKIMAAVAAFQAEARPPCCMMILAVSAKSRPNAI